MHVLEGDTLGGWRPDKNVKRMIIHMCDAPPHDPEPFTGYTAWDVIAKAIWSGVVIESKPDARLGLGAIESRGAVGIYPIVIGGDSTTLSYMGALADGSGGSVFTAYGSSDVVAAVMAAVTEAVSSPFVDAGGPYDAPIGSTIVFDASGSYDSDGTIVKYEWDWEGDGVYDETTTMPIASHSWPSEYSGFVRVRATDDAALTGVDTAPVEVYPVTNWGQYKVVYTHNRKTVVNPPDILTTKGVTIVSGAANDTLVIKKANSKVALTQPMHTVISNTGIKKLTIDGDVKSVQAGGVLGSLTVNSGCAGVVIASAVGSVKMTNTSGRAASTTIVTDSAGPKANINLAGVVLQNISLPNQDVQTIHVSSKKYRNPKTKTTTLSLSGIGTYDEVKASSQGLRLTAPPRRMLRVGAAAAIATAKTIRSITASGAPVLPDRIQAGLASLSARGALFKLDSGSWILPGDVRMALLQSSAPTLSVSANSGDMVIATLAANGRITNLGASYCKYKDGVTTKSVGGHVGLPGYATSMQVGAGVDPDAKADIVSIHGSLGVAGIFMAGATFADSKFTATYRGNITNITTLKPSPKLPESPVITGYGYVEDGTKLQKKLSKQGNATGFYVYSAP